MSVPADFVHIVAEGLGLKATEEAAKTLAPDVEYRIREIVQVRNIATIANPAINCPALLDLKRTLFSGHPLTSNSPASTALSNV
jgi:hypothetical protein